MSNGRLLLTAILVASTALGTTPDFALVDLEGRPASLRDYTGRSPVLVVLYRGFW